MQRGSAAPVPYVHLLMPQSEHLLHGHDPSASKAFIVLAHLDGLQPLRHRSERCTITAASAGQADGHSEEQCRFGSLIIYCYILFTDDHQLMANTKTNTVVGKEK